MPKRCVAAGCNNSVEKEGISVYTFPKDEALKKKWTNQVQRTRTGPTINSVLCSEHFTEECFEESNIIHQSFGLKKNRRLKKGAVSSIFKRKAADDACSSVTETKISICKEGTKKGKFNKHTCMDN